ncbi:MAG: hypothetical protein QM763_12075 [Agriterribacter sp.]
MSTKYQFVRPFLMISCIMLFLYSCKKNDYIVGGAAHDVNMYKNMSNYDMLKTNPAFDTLVQVIDAAGVKDVINAQGTTFFAPSDYSIFSYLNKRTIYVQNNIDINGKFGLDSLLYYVSNNVNGTKDSLLMYVIKQPLTYDVLKSDGALYPTALSGDTAAVSYEYTYDEVLGYNSIVSTVPRIVYFTHLWYHYDLDEDNSAGDIPNDIGVRTLVKTSCILTQNGIVNALEPSHTLFFYGTKQ